MKKADFCLPSHAGLHPEKVEPAIDNLHGENHEYRCTNNYIV